MQQTSILAANKIMLSAIDVPTSSGKLEPRSSCLSWPTEGLIENAHPRWCANQGLRYPPGAFSIQDLGIPVPPMSLYRYRCPVGAFAPHKTVSPFWSTNANDDQKLLRPHVKRFSQLTEAIGDV
jgi:hypothetical protein